MFVCLLHLLIDHIRSYSFSHFTTPYVLTITPIVVFTSYYTVFSHTYHIYSPHHVLLHDLAVCQHKFYIIMYSK